MPEGIARYIRAACCYLGCPALGGRSLHEARELPPQYLSILPRLAQFGDLTGEQGVEVRFQPSVVTHESSADAPKNVLLVGVYHDLRAGVDELELVADTLQSGLETRD